MRFTASSVTFERDGVRLVAGGFQPVAAYDVLIANLDPALERRAAPDDPAELLGRLPRRPDDAGDRRAARRAATTSPDRAAAETALLELVFDGRAERIGLGDDAVWIAPERTEWFHGILHAAEPAGTRVNRDPIGATA